MIISSDAVDYTFERRLELVARDSKEEGIAQGILTVIKSALSTGKSPEEIAEFTNIPLEDVLKAIEEK